MAVSLGGYSFVDNNRIFNKSKTGKTATSAEVGKRYTLGDLKPGLSFKAEVVDVNSSNIKLRLSDGQTISARVDGAGEFNIGEDVSFTVKSNDGEVLNITPEKLPSEVNPTLLKALTAADIRVNGDTLDMVQTMMEEQLPVDKQSLQNMYRNSLRFPEVDMKTLVQMTRFNMPIDEENIYQFENYKNAEKQIGKNLYILTKDLINVLDGLNAEIEGQISTIYAESTTNMKLASIEPEIIGNASLPSEDENGQILSEKNVKLQDNELENQDVGKNGQNLLGKNQVSDDVNLDTSNYDKNGENLQKLTSKMEQISNLNGDLLEISLGENLDKNNEALKTDVQNQPIFELLNKEEISKLAENLKNAGMDKNTVDSMLKGELGDLDLLAEVKSKINNTPQEMAFIGDKGYQKLLSNAIIKQWFIKPSEVAEEGSLSRLYEKLDKQVKSILEDIQKIGQEELAKNVVDKALSNTSQSAIHTAGNIEFMNQVNQLYSYIQIPLQMHGQNASSDLYVFTNKKNLVDQDGEVKAMLHLDMEALGPVDAFLKLENMKLDTKFSLGSDEVYDLFEKHIDKLVARLEAKGYNCKIHFEKNEDEKGGIDFVEDFLKQGSSVGTMQRFSFDMRA